MKCIVAENENWARIIMSAFGLSPEEWTPRGFFDAVLSHRWDEIVVIPPSQGWTERHVRWVNEVLRLRSEKLTIL